MGEIISSFARVEYKYYLTPEQFQALSPVLDAHFSRDQYGIHTICNLFYDTDNFEIIRNSIEKPLYKEKLRLRSYGVPANDDSTVFIELKKKYDHIVYKRRINTTLVQAEQFLQGGNIPTGADLQISREINNFLSLHPIVPKVVLCYDRLAMFCKDDPDLRITTDRNLRWRETELDLRAGSHGMLIIPEDITLMEIKFAGAMPLWLAHELSRCGIYKTSFSKIGTCYKHFIIPEKFTERVVHTNVY